MPCFFNGSVQKTRVQGEGLGVAGFTNRECYIYWEAGVVHSQNWFPPKNLLVKDAIFNLNDNV